jgi:hypothetical protein
MKKRLSALTLAFVLLWAVITALASGAPGSPANPLVTLSYLRDRFTPTITAETAKQAEAALNDKNRQLSPESVIVSSPAAKKAISDQVLAAIRNTGGRNQAVSVQAGQTLALGQGTRFILTSGNARLGSSAVNLTTGADVASGANLALNHRMMFVDGGGTLTFSAMSNVLINGRYSLNTIVYRPKYNDLAQALYDMGLIRGTGQGFALDRGVTRVEMLYMMLTLLGERDIADAYTGAQAFTDVPDWAANAVAFAHSKGYTQGTGGTHFSPHTSADAGQFATMLLRVLGYSDAPGGQFTWDRGLEFGSTVELFTASEAAGLRELFMRDHLIYMSYYALDARLMGSGQTLQDMLISRGVLSSSTAHSVRSRVTRVRGL